MANLINQYLLKKDGVILTNFFISKLFTGFIKTMEAKEILRLHIGKVAMLTGGRSDYFLSQSKKQNFRKKQAFINDGNHVNSEYLMVSGCIKSFLKNKKIAVNKEH